MEFESTVMSDKREKSQETRCLQYYVLQEEKRIGEVRQKLEQWRIKL